MILETVLLASFFHKHKPKVSAPTVEQLAFAKLLEEDNKILLNGITGAQAFEKDVKFAQYERPEIDAFERQIFKCVNDKEEDLDADVDVLIELGNTLQALDDVLHSRNAI